MNVTLHSQFITLKPDTPSSSLNIFLINLTRSLYIVLGAFPQATDLQKFKTDQNFHQQNVYIHHYQYMLLK